MLVSSQSLMFQGLTYLDILNSAYNLMQFEHMAAVLASLLYNSNIVYTTYIDSNGNEIKTQSPENLNIEFTGRQSKITNLCGWA